MATQSPEDTLRMALVINNAARMGGSERQCLLLATELARRNWTPILLSLAGDGPVLEQARRRGIETDAVALRFPLSPWYFPRNMFRAWRLFRSIRADVIIGYTSVPNLYIGWLGRRTGARAFIWSSRNAGLDRPPAWMEQIALRRADAFIANSPASRDFLARAFPRAVPQTAIIPNGVAIPDLPADTSGQEVVCVANVRPEKDHATLLKAWRIVKRSRPDATLRLIGHFEENTSYTKHIQALAAVPELMNSVRFSGSTSDITTALSNAAIGVLSSRTEGMPNAVLEYMAAGLPVVATDLPGIRLALGDEADQWLVPVGHAEMLGARLLELLQNNALRASVGGANRDRAKKEFSIAQMGERTISVIRKILQ